MNLRLQLARVVERVPGIGPIVSFGLDPIGALRAPETFKHRMEGWMGVVVNVAGPVLRRVPTPALRGVGRAMVRGLRRRIADSQHPSPIGETRDRAKTDPRTAEVRRLFRDAAKNAPGAALKLALAVQHEDAIFPSASVIARLRDAFENDGETLGESVMSVVSRSDELLRDHAATLLKLLDLAGGGTPTVLRPSAGLGDLVGAIERHPKAVGYSGLIDLDAAHLRNAACHGRDRYTHANETVEWSDQRTPPKVAHVVEFAEKAADLLFVAGPVFEQGARDFMMFDTPIAALQRKEVLLSLLDHGEKWLSDDSNERDAAERDIAAVIKPVWESYQAMRVGA